MKQTTIILADDHNVVRQGLRALLEAEPDFCVVGEAADGLDALQMVEHLKPDVLVVDLVMPGISGLEVTRQVTGRNRGTRVVVLSMHASESYVLEALRNGANAYVLKDSTAADLVGAVRHAAAGRRFLSPPLSARAIDAYVDKAKAAPPDPYDLLTRREREVLQLAANGLSCNEIAEELSVSPRTVESHRANLLRKLDLHSQTDLVRYCIQRGVLPRQ